MKIFIGEAIKREDYNSFMQGNQISSNILKFRGHAESEEDFIEFYKEPFQYYVLNKKNVRELHHGRDRTLEEIYRYLKKEYSVARDSTISVQNEEGKYLMNTFFGNIKTCVYLDYVVLEYSFKRNKDNKISNINIVLDTED